MVLFKDAACFSQEGFSRDTTAMFGQKQTLMLHLFTATNKALWLTIGQAIRNTGGNPIVSQEKHMVPAQWGCNSLCTSGLKSYHLHLQRSLDWMGLDNDLASQVTGPHTTLKP
jgi:hypothetical protein